MRTNLMAAMGIAGSAQMQPRALTHRPSRLTATPRVPYADMDSQEDPSPPTPFSGDDSQQFEDGRASFASNATSSGQSKSEPTPKRPRPRKSIKVHSPAKPVARPSTSLRSAARPSLSTQVVRSSTRIRQPLLGVSGNQNRPPPRHSLKTPSKGHNFGGDEETFDGSELFSGTQGKDLMELGGALDDETETGL